MFKKIVFGLICFFTFLVAVLAVHIYMVTKPKAGAISSLTLSRIDFPERFDSLQGVAIKEHIAKMEGVKDVRVNFSNSHIICLYDRKEFSGSDLVDRINFHFSESAQLFQPSEEMLAQSCPAIDKNSITYKLGAFFQKSFEN
ncbi:heavy metal-associated domain-containing protein [Aquiflexum sp.]|uniref:heavy-metal-associated domain-containing protein n=1 Tax=Aquiflexum sp. TaxID=1872584 RepID=UPI0035938F1A